jgi:hypothetical protein
MIKWCKNQKLLYVSIYPKCVYKNQEDCWGIASSIKKNVTAYKYGTKKSKLKKLKINSLADGMAVLFYFNGLECFHHKYKYSLKR